jgi:hypothetical protein
MIHPETHWSFITILVVASGALACGGDDGPGSTADPDDTTTPDDTTRPDDTTHPDDTTEPTCTEAPLFEPQSFGEDGTDLIRHIAIDSQTGDLVFSVWQELYRLPAGSRAPELMMDRPPEAQPIYGAFWLVDNDILMPAAPGIGSILTAAVPGAEMDLVPVLYRAPRTGGAATLQVSALMPSEEQVFYQIGGARLVGDEVFWVDSRNEREDFSTASPIDRTYRAWRTNWRTPAEPDLLYTSEFELEVPVVVNGVAYIEEANSDSAQDGSRQRMIRLADGTVAPSSAEDTYGGRVIAGDDQSLIVYHELASLETVEDYGLYRVALDGSEEERLYQGFTQLDWRSNSGSWAYDVYNVDADTSDIYFYRPGSAPRLLGCIAANGTTVHDVVAGADAVYVSVFYGGLKATILRYPL